MYIYVYMYMVAILTGSLESLTIHNRYIII